MKGSPTPSTSLYKEPIKRCSQIRPGRAISRTPGGTQVMAQTASPPWPPSLFAFKCHTYVLLPDGTLEFSSLVLYNKDASLQRACGWGFLGFQRGSGGETTCLWCLNSVLKSEPQTKSVFIFSILGNQVESSYTSLFFCCFSILSIASLLKEWNSFE